MATSDGLDDPFAKPTVVTYDQFVRAFREFSNPDIAPEETVEFWLRQAELQLGEGRFGSVRVLAIMLYAAHNLVLSIRDAKGAASSGIPGMFFGLVASKSVGSVSVSYDNSMLKTTGSYWNMSTYGMRLYSLLKGSTLPIYVPGIATLEKIYGYVPGTPNLPRP